MLPAYTTRLLLRPLATFEVISIAFFFFVLFHNWNFWFRFVCLGTCFQIWTLLRAKGLTFFLARRKAVSPMSQIIQSVDPPEINKQKKNTVAIFLLCVSFYCFQLTTIGSRPRLQGEFARFVRKAFTFRTVDLSTSNWLLDNSHVVLVINNPIFIT